MSAIDAGEDAISKKRIPENGVSYWTSPDGTVKVTPDNYEKARELHLGGW